MSQIVILNLKLIFNSFWYKYI